MGGIRSLVTGIALVLVPRLAFAAVCAERSDCPPYFECVDGACAEANIACPAQCPPHLNCQPTSTTPNPTPNPSGAEPAPSDFFCGWSVRACGPTGQCAEHFECVRCEASEKYISCSIDRCMPSRIPCQVHADCPEFFYCNDFTAEEIPSYWPPGAGRACKPLLGAGTYAPRELRGGTLIDDASASGGKSAGGGPNTSGGSTAGGSTAGGSTTGGSTAGGSSTAPSADPNDKTERMDETTSSCTCRTPPQRTQPGWLAVLAFAVGVSALRRARHARAPRS